MKEFNDKKYDTMLFARSCINKNQITKNPGDIWPMVPNRSLGANQNKPTGMSRNVAFAIPSTNTDTPSNRHKRARDDEGSQTKDCPSKKCRVVANLFTATAKQLQLDVLLTGVVVVIDFTSCSDTYKTSLQMHHFRCAGTMRKAASNVILLIS